jgi:hypothetical protein
MGTAVYDGTVFDTDNTFEGDEKLHVFFFTEAKQNMIKSAEAGRPIFDEVEMIRIFTPGSKDVLTNRLNEVYKRRFQSRYESWKTKKSQEIKGTPLDQVPFLTITQIAELKAYNVLTLEMLADLPDSAAHNFLGAQQLKQRAQAYLAAAKDAAPITALQAALEERDSKIEVLTGQVADLVAQVKTLMAGNKKAA